MEANVGESFQIQILFNIFPRISLHCKLVQSNTENTNMVLLDHIRLIRRIWSNKTIFVFSVLDWN